MSTLAFPNLESRISNPGMVLRATAVAKTYSEGNLRTEVLKSVDFELGRGETLAIVGASGAGKSTLLHILGGLDTLSAGEVEVADIGLPAARTRHEHVTEQILDEVPRRGPGDNKYTAGSVLVVGGSTGKTGAPCLTAEAALRAGAGIVTVCVPASLNLVFEQRLLEVMSRPCADEDGVMTMDAADAIVEAAEKATAVAIGPGIGRTDAVRALIGYLLDRLDKPTVLDADGLWAVAGHLDWVFSRDAPTVLTPHAGELARLLGRDSSAVSARRLNAVQTGADDVGAVVLLKGADTLVASPGRGVLVCDLGNPGLATAGTGDVLTGIVAAFLSKGMGAKVGAAAAAAAGGEAARLAGETHGSAGMIASDVVEALSPTLSR